MAITYPTVTVASQDFPALATLGDADHYLLADPEASAFREGEADDRGRWLIGASRAILREPLAPGTLDGPDIPPPLALAAIVLAAAIAGGFSLANPAPAALKRLKAGSVEQDFFYQDTLTTRFPAAVMDLLTVFLATGAPVAGSLSNGVCGRSSFDDPFGTIYPGASDDVDRWRRSYD